MTGSAAGVETWLITYRSYSDADLEAELSWLRTQSRNLFSAQTEGERSYARSTAEIRDRLAAATQAMNERSGADQDRTLVADFSQVRLG